MKSPDSQSKVQANLSAPTQEEGQVEGKSLAPPAFKVTAGGDGAEGGGQNLPNGLPLTLAQKLKAALGIDPSRAELVLNSSKAVELGARAFTQLNKLHFAPGQFNPHTKEGIELIGHEFTHYAQQLAGRVTATTEVAGMAVNDDPALERAADVMGAKIAAGDASGAASQASGGTTSPVVQAKMEAAPENAAPQTAAPEGEGVPTPEQGDAVDPAVRMAQEIAAEVGNAELAALPDQHPTQVPASVQQPTTQTTAAPQAEAKTATGPVVQRWGWLKKLWNGVKSAASTVWNGAKTVAKAVWSGVKTVASAVWTGVKAVGGYVWNVIKSVVALGHAAIIKVWPRIWKLIVHLGSGAWDLLKWLWTGIKTTFTKPGDLGKWFIDGLKGGGAWAGRLFTKLLDVVGFAEMLDLLGQVIKFNTRTLTSTEIDEAKKVFGNAVPYWKVRVDEYSLIAALGKWFQGASGMGVTIGYTINFSQKVAPAPGNSDMHWMIHELTHVAQAEAVGLQYIPEALIAQAGTGYNYGGPSALVGKHLRDFNREQQGDICADYYGDVLYGSTPATNYQPLIDEAKRGEF